MKTAHWSTVTRALAGKYQLSWSDAKAVYDGMKSRAGRATSLRMVAAAPPKLPRSLKPKPAPKPAPVRKAPQPPPVAKPKPKPAPPAKQASARRQAPARPAPAPRPAPTIPPKEKPRQAPARPAKPARKTKAGLRLTKEEARAALERIDQAQARAREAASPFAGSALQPAPAPPPRPVPVEVPKRQGARNKFERVLRERGLPVSIAKHAAGKDAVGAWRNDRLQRQIGDELKRAYRDIGKAGRISEGARNRLESLVTKLLPNADGLKRRDVFMQFMRELYGKGGKK